MLRIRRFGIIQTATVAAAFSAVSVLVVFAIIAVFVLLVGTPRGFGEGGLSFGMQGFVGIVIAGVIGAVLYGIVGFIAAAIGCALYNLIAGWTGGIELQIDQVAPPPQPDWGAQPPAPPVPPATPAPTNQPSGTPTP
jgi:hypothetical protein